jgi:arylsulfatase A-like enzyme
MSDSRQRQDSLILITVDCLRADHVGFLGYSRPTTPFLDSLAKQSTVVPNAVVAGAPTYYSFPAIFASRYPLDLGRDVIGLAPDEPTLASTLKTAGYATAAFCAGNPYLTRRFGYDQGFDNFHDFLDSAQTNPEYTTGNDVRVRTRLNRKLEMWSHKWRWAGQAYDDLYFEYCQCSPNSHPDSLDGLRRYPSAEVLVDEASDWLTSVAGQPFFLWLHFMDPHAPYYPPERALRSMDAGVSATRAQYLNSYWNRGNLPPDRLEKYRKSMVGLYDAGIRWVDTQLARLIESLHGLGAWDDCVLALSADHGEEFLDHGGTFHSPGNVSEEITRVPLLLRVPGQRCQRTGSTPFSLLHLAPTLLDILRTECPREFRGRSRWQSLQNGHSLDDPAITECVTDAGNVFHRRERLGCRTLAVKDERFKLVWDLGTKEERFFDLQQDPNELRPMLADEAKDGRRRLMSRARQHLAESQERLDERLRCRALLREFASEWASGRGGAVKAS